MSPAHHEPQPGIVIAMQALNRAAWLLAGFGCVGAHAVDAKAETGFGLEISFKGDVSGAGADAVAAGGKKFSSACDEVIIPKWLSDVGMGGMSVGSHVDKARYTCHLHYRVRDAAAAAGTLEDGFRIMLGAIVDQRRAGRLTLQARPSGLGMRIQLEFAPAIIGASDAPPHLRANHQISVSLSGTRVIEADGAARRDGKKATWFIPLASLVTTTDTSPVRIDAVIAD